MSNNQERINLQQGRPQREEVRDHVPFKANLGMIDRWLMGREGKQTKVAEKTTQITSSNHKKIDIGQKVTLSAPIWKTYTILSALVDSSTFTIKRGFKKQIAEDYLGMTVRAFQQHLNVLYEIGLLEFYEKQLKGETVTDISVYPYPHYADTQACYLVRYRSIEDREGKGLEKSKRANKARIEKLLLAKEAEEAAEVEKKSSQPKKMDHEKKNSQGLEKKSSQGVEKKSSQGVEKKSSHTKVIMIQSNNVQNNNVQKINQEDIDNSGLPTEIKEAATSNIDRLIHLNISILDIVNNYKAHKDSLEVSRYVEALEYALGLDSFAKGFEHVMKKNVERQIEFANGNANSKKKSKPNFKVVRKEMVPQWLKDKKHQEAAPKEEIDADFEEQKRQLEQELKELAQELKAKKPSFEEQKADLEKRLAKHDKSVLTN